MVQMKKHFFLLNRQKPYLHQVPATVKRANGIIATGGSGYAGLPLDWRQVLMYSLFPFPTNSREDPNFLRKMKRKKRNLSHFFQLHILPTPQIIKAVRTALSRKDFANMKRNLLDKRSYHTQLFGKRSVSTIFSR